jgi:hypothetical protein
MKDIQEIIKRELHPSIEDTIDSTIKSPLERLWELEKQCADETGREPMMIMEGPVQ